MKRDEVESGFNAEDEKKEIKTIEDQKKEEIRKENRKALKTYIPVLILCTLLGGVFGYFANNSGLQGAADQIAAWTEKALFVLMPYCIIATAVISFALSLYHYNVAKKLYADFDEDADPDDDEADLYARADRKLSSAVSASGIGQITGMLFFAVFFSDLDAHLEQHSALALVTTIIFIAGIFLTVRMQQLQIDFVKRMSPSMKGSVYDSKFHQKWEESCDEAERLVIYKASYKAYRFANIACSAGWAVTIMGSLILHYGCLPSVVISALWMLMNIVYYREAMRLERSKINR